ncbi:MAG: hypothetical protein JNM31_15505 [Flavobacteriales bacterium]|nr:hypothetical protein [Flavobacteriales bacterium]
MTLDLLSAFDRHKYGIIGTLMVHTLVLFGLAISEMRTEPDEDKRSELRIDIAPPMTEEEFQRLEQQLAADQPPTEWQRIQSAVNNPEDPATPRERLDARTQERISEKVWNDLKEMEQAEFERLSAERKEAGEEVEIPELDTAKWNKDRYLPKDLPPPAPVDGPVAVDHTLKPRQLYIRVPMYLCKGQGKVVLQVAVDAEGRVGQIKVDATTQADACMVDFAVERTGTARFSRASGQPDPHRGTVTFLFQAQ